MIRLLHRPGHFVVARPSTRHRVASGRGAGVERALRRAHITGSNRTLAQDLAFAVDQLVEIAIRALSPAVNDTFTALTCIDWLGDEPVQGHGALAPAPRAPRQPRLRARDHGAGQLRAAGRAVVREDPPGRPRDARSADPPARGADQDRRTDDRRRQRELLLEQAAMILRASEESVPEPADRADVGGRTRTCLLAAGRKRRLGDRTRWDRPPSPLPLRAGSSRLSSRAGTELHQPGPSSCPIAQRAPPRGPPPALAVAADLGNQPVAGSESVDMK